jgi:hypothetical protein
MQPLLTHQLGSGALTFVSVIVAQLPRGCLVASHCVASVSWAALARATGAGMLGHAVTGGPCELAASQSVVAQGCVDMLVSALHVQRTGADCVQYCAVVLNCTVMHAL